MRTVYGAEYSVSPGPGMDGSGLLFPLSITSQVKHSPCVFSSELMVGVGGPCQS